MKLIVFDLDFTLWDAGGVWCDCTCPPYKQNGDHVIDSEGRKIALYDDVRDMLETLSNKNYSLGLASRTDAPDWARELLQLLGIEHYFEHAEIYPGSKVRHFERIKEESGFDYKDMAFFDDEMRNIREVGALGVRVSYVEEGVNWAHIHEVLG